MPLRVPPVVFPNGDAHWNAKIPQVDMPIPSRTPVANSLLGPVDIHRMRRVASKCG